MNKEERSEALINDKVKPVSQMRKKLSGIAAVSFFIAVFDRLGELIYNALIHGLFGTIFSSYSYLQKKFTESLFGRILFGNHAPRRFFKKLRGFFARNIESGFFVVQSRRLMKYFYSLPLNSYGNFFLFFGVYTIVVYFLKLLIPGLGTADPDYLITGIVIFIAALPMCFSRISLARAVKMSVIGNMIFHGAFGLPEKLFDAKGQKTQSKGNFMFVLGLIAGIMTFFVSPITIVFAIFGTIFIVIVAVAPEIGVLLSVALLPFLSFFEKPTVILCSLILCTTFFYLLKVLRGKRVFKFEILDAFVLIFGAMIMFSSIFSAGTDSSFDEACAAVILLLGYFLLVNLMRTQAWIKRCIYALIGSAAVVAIIGVFEYFFADKSSQWLDISLFSDIKVRVVSLFENPNILAMFLVMAFPFVIATFCLSNQKNERRLCFLVGTIIVLCTLFTWSRGAWIAILFGALVFFMIYTRKSFRIFGVLLFAIPLLPILLPDNVINRFLSITNLADSSISYRIYTWKGTMNMIGNYLFGGIGYGNEAFQSIYPNYAYAGMEASAHSHSLFLQIIAYMGILGIIVFAIVMILNFQKCFEYIRKPENTTSKLYVAAAISALVAALIMGIFDYIWYNYRVLYVFWIVMAIGCAFVRVGETEILRKEDDVSSEIMN